MRANNYSALYLTFFFLFINWVNVSGQYFQQEVHYKIQVKLNDVKHTLSAFETFEYINHSPDTLNEIYIHLWPNAYKNKNTALSRESLSDRSTRIYFAAEKDRGFIDSLSFKADGRDVQWFFDSLHIDIAKIKLASPLPPSGSVVISTPFFIKIPDGKLSRCGHIGQAYAISQWYPKPAVYDELGWHQMPYLNKGEFYSEFGSFEVSITLPKNYVVGATGELQNEEEMEWLENKVSETLSIDKFDKDMKFPLSDANYKTVVYKQENIHDFAWFADKRFHVLKGEVNLPNTTRKVTTWAMFTNSEGELWKKSISYINQTIYYYSLWNGDYAYKNCTVVDGTITAGTGMEYPTIAIIGKAGSDFVLEDVIVHEVGHNWFYGMVGNNERDHGWMDEGINTANEIRYLMKFYNNDTARIKNVAGRAGILGKITGISGLNMQNFEYLEYLYAARSRKDQPIETKSVDFTELNYGLIMYSKTGLGFNYLRSYLGDEMYDSCMHDYFNQWKFRHPYPKDIRKIFSERTGKNLNWFFDDFLQTTKKADYQVCSLQRIYGDSFINPGAKGFAVKITNTGNTAPPFSVSGVKNGQILYTKWHEGFNGSDTISISCDQCDRIKIDAMEVIPEVNRNNNSIRTRGVLRKLEPISFPFLMRIENPDRTQISWLPVAGWNNYNKTMVGLAVHNLTIVNKKFQYVLAPMYSFNLKELSGSAKISYSIYSEKSDFDLINLSVSSRRFAYLIDDYRNYEKIITSTHLNYSQMNGEIKIHLRKANLISPWSNSIVLRNLNLWKEVIEYNKLADGSFGGNIATQYQYHNQLLFNFKNNRSNDPFRINLTLEQNNEYFRYSAELNYRFSYRQPNRGFDLRFFFGSYLTNVNSTNNFHLTGTGNTLTGSEDYLFDNLYLGRTESKGILSKQFYEQEGGFKVYSPIGRSNRWIASLNIKSHLPGKLPVRIFADIGLYDGANRSYEEYKGLTFDAGLEVYLIQNIFEVYLPLIISRDIDNFYKVNELKFTDRIRFVFNINALSPFRLRETIEDI